MSTTKRLPLTSQIERWRTLSQAMAGRAESAVSSSRDTLIEMLTTAIELEFATIPPYLCALWSIKDDLHPVAKSLREIVQEEMLHMGLACNMLAAIGGQPPLRNLATKYPEHVPGGIHPDLEVHLQGLNKSALEAFLQIEAPVELAQGVPLEPGDPNWSQDPDVRSIGEFYGCVAAAFENYSDAGGTFSLANQVSASLVWRVIGSPGDVKTAIGIITSQGEGATLRGQAGRTPLDSSRNDYAHYYRFLEIWKEKRLVRRRGDDKDAEQYEWIAGYPLPERFPMGPVPAQGYAEASPVVRQLLADFDRTYHEVLGLLEATWRPGGQGQLVHAIAKMFELERYAKPLMAIEIPTAGAQPAGEPRPTYGPLFTPPVTEQGP